MSMIIGKALIAGGGGTVARLEFEYTGTYNERLEDGVVEFLTSGVLTFKKETAIDVFMVGGGSSGNSGRTTQPDSDADGSGGGAGGYTKTLLNIIPRARQGYQVIIGSGGFGGGPRRRPGCFNPSWTCWRCGWWKRGLL